LEELYDKFMALALIEAEKAGKKGEVPVGAIIIDSQGKVVARGHNLRESKNDPTAHAERVASRKASKKNGSWRLAGCTIFVTLEPCPMCAGALVNSRIKRVVFGCRDPKAGSCGTLMDITSDSRLNHRVEAVSGVLEEKCSKILKDFFKSRRSRGN